MPFLPLLLVLLAPARAGVPSPLPSTVPPVVSGSVSGKFDVTSSGAGSYQVSLTVPPGTNGLSPQLSLSYQSGGSNGLTGVGFALTGLPAISRTGRTLLEDGQRGGVNYDANDRFALSGGRLININSVSGGYGGAGAEYRTEQESWQKVIANGQCGSGPCSFTVTSPGGTVQQFTGVPAAGALFANAPYAGSMREWVLTSVTDTNGNSMSITWSASPPQYGGTPISGSSGAMFPVTITYTANTAASLTARRSVQFFYESRPDPVMTNAGGAVSYTNVRLAHVQTFVTPASTPVLVTDYRLAYASGPSQRSRLASITECDGQGICMPPTNFSWSAGPTGLITQNGTLENISTNQGWEGDFNGDGRTDVLSQATMVNCLATGTGFNCGNPLDIETGTFSVVADFNGDGRSDFFSGGGTVGNLYLGTATGLTSNGTQPTTMDLENPFYVADFNGDGMADLFSQGYVQLSTGNGFATQPLGPFTNLNLEQGQIYAADFNGDGMADLFSTGCNAGSIYEFNGNGFTEVDVSGLQLCADNVFLDDFNGDALPDLVSVTGGTGTIWYNTGHGFTSSATINDLNTEAGQSWPGDFNGDGRADVYVQTSSTGGVLYASVMPQSSGATQFVQVPITNASVSATTSFSGDFNGDGIADFYDSDAQQFMFGGTAGAASPATTNQLPDLLTTIVTGIGGQTSITYKPMTDPSVYTPSGSPSSPQQVPADYGIEGSLLINQFAAQPMSVAQTAQYPITLSRGASYLVSGYTIANAPSINDQSYSYSYGYRYAGAVMNLAGRGFLGFLMRTRTDPQLDARLTTIYALPFPYSGKTLTRATCANASSTSACTHSDPNFLAATQYEYSCTDSLTGAQCVVDNTSYSATATTVFEVLTKSVTRDDEQWGSKSTSTYGYDAFGNRTSMTHTGSTAQSALYGCSQYLNDTTAWRIGFPVEQKYSSVAGCPDKWDTYAYAATDLSWQRTGYDARMNVVAKSKWDAANNQFLGTRYTYDAFGNALTMTTLRHVPGSKPVLVANTTNTTTYDTTFQTFAATNTTPLANPSVATSALTTSTLYDPRFGVMIGETNANGFVQTTCLDGFGRTAAMQGPQVQSGGKTEKNCLGAITAFAVPSQFSSAPVITLTATTRSPVTGTSVWEETATRNAWSSPSTWTLTRSTYDGLKREVLTATPSDTAGVSVLEQLTYLDPRHVQRQSLPYFSNASPLWQTATYDARGRKTSLTRPFQSTSGSTDTTTWTYCSGSSVLITLDPSEGVTCNDPTPPSYTSQIVAAYDQFFHGPRRISQTQTENQSALTTFQRDPLGRLTTLLAPASRVDGTRVATTTVFDSLGRVSSGSVSDAIDIDYTYDDEGLLDHQTDALGQKLAFTYDGLERTLTRTAYDSGGSIARTATYTWDTPAGGIYTNVAGREATATATDASGNLISSYAWGYDAYGRPTVNSATMNGATYTFNTSSDPQGRPATLTYPNGATLAATLTPGGHLGTLALTPKGGSTSTYLTASNYDAAGAAGTLLYGNGVTDTRTYTPQETMLTHTITSASGGTLLNATYQWDANGNPLSDGMSTYGYTAGQLTSSNGPAGSFTFGYDANGNMTSLNGATLAYSGYQLGSGTNGFAASYDAAGNMTSRTPAGSPDVWTQTFDPEGNLVSLQRNGVLQRVFTYDDQGRRVSATTYAADGTSVDSTSWRIGPYLELTQSGSNTQQSLFVDDSYGHVAALTASNGGSASPSFFHRNHLKSTVRVTNGAGAQSASIDYAPYGLPKIESGDTQALGPLFNGRPYDAGTALMDFNARIYDAASGQFLSADSRYSGPYTRPNTPQRYIFGWGTPASHADPSGHVFGLDLLIGITIEEGTEALMEEGAMDLMAMQSSTRGSSDSMELVSDDELSDDDSAFEPDDSGDESDESEDEDDDPNPLPPIMTGNLVYNNQFVATLTQADVDDVYRRYGGKDKFDKVTKRVSWRKKNVEEDLAAARARAGRTNANEFICATCPEVLTGDKTYQSGSRLIVDYQRDHFNMIHADRRQLVLTLGTQKHGGKIFTRKEFINFYHEDIRLTCPACNVGHSHEPEEWETTFSLWAYLYDTLQTRFAP